MTHYHKERENYSATNWPDSDEKMTAIMQNGGDGAHHDELIRNKIVKGEALTCAEFNRWTNQNAK